MQARNPRHNKGAARMNGAEFETYGRDSNRPAPPFFTEPHLG